jgi:hypothetical protein
MSGKRRWIALIPIVYLALGIAGLIQVPGWNERSQYALVRALHSGTVRIDRYAADTGDKGFYMGHWYSDKAPGLALFTTPYYAATQSLGIRSSNEPKEIHIIAIFGTVLPFAVLLFLIASFVDRLEPRLGTPSAMILGLGSLLVPFSTLFFSHVFSACLGFAAYYLLWRQRQSQRHEAPIVFAGLLAGFAVASEYPQALLAIILAGYALGRPFSPRRLLLFGAGLLIGIIPLLTYNWVGFGSPFRVSYANVAANQVGLFGMVPFSLHALLDLLFGARGLFTLTPVLAIAVPGIVLLYRSGRRSEAALAATVGVVALGYNASYWAPFGGWTPGPRFLIDMLPFLGLPLAAALRRAPLPTLALGAVSAATMVAATLTIPELPTTLSTSVWFSRLEHGVLAPEIGLGQVLWFGVLAVLAIFITIALAPRLRFERSQVALTVLALLIWLLIDRFGGSLISGHAIGGEIALIAIVATAALVTWQSAVRLRRSPRRPLKKAVS